MGHIHLAETDGGGIVMGPAECLLRFALLCVPPLRRVAPLVAKCGARFLRLWNAMDASCVCLFSCVQTGLLGLQSPQSDLQCDSPDAKQSLWEVLHRARALLTLRMGRLCRCQGLPCCALGESEGLERQQESNSGTPLCPVCCNVWSCPAADHAEVTVLH